MKHYQIQDYLRYDAEPDQMTLSKGILLFFIIAAILLACVYVAS